jgi:hypothetical protein
LNKRFAKVIDKDIYAFNIPRSYSRYDNLEQIAFRYCSVEHLIFEIRQSISLFTPGKQIEVKQRVKALVEASSSTTAERAAAVPKTVQTVLKYKRCNDTMEARSQ